MIAGRDAIAV
jgi:aromatic ring hydroxylase